MRTIKELEAVLEEQFPPHYDAHRDRMASHWEMRETVNQLGHALRDAVALLKKPTLGESDGR